MLVRHKPVFRDRPPTVSEESLALLVQFFAPRLGPNRRAAAEAVLKAQTMPGCLLRIVFTDLDQIHETVAVAEHILAVEGWLDEEKTRKAMFSSHPMLELRNGSGIEFEVEYTSPFTGKKLSTMWKKPA